MWRSDFIVTVTDDYAFVSASRSLLCLRLRLRLCLLCFAFFFRLATIGAPRTLHVRGVFSGCIAWSDIGANPVLRKSPPIRKRKAKKEKKKKGQVGVISVE
jgi:hypothetical protein